MCKDSIMIYLQVSSICCCLAPKQGFSCIQHIIPQRSYDWAAIRKWIREMIRIRYEWNSSCIDKLEINDTKILTIHFVSAYFAFANYVIINILLRKTQYSIRMKAQMPTNSFQFASTLEIVVDKYYIWNVGFSKQSWCYWMIITKRTEEK